MHRYVYIPHAKSRIRTNSIQKSLTQFTTHSLTHPDPWLSDDEGPFAIHIARGPVTLTGYRGTGTLTRETGLVTAIHIHIDMDMYSMKKAWSQPCTYT